MHRGSIYLRAVILAISGMAMAAPVSAAPAAGAPERALLDRYCVSCHNERVQTAGVALDTADLSDVRADAEVWEKVVRKLRGGVMPPVGRPRPAPAEYDQLASWLETELDRVWSEHPNPGRTETFHRLNRAEYANAVRDLLALDLPIDDFLPADDASYGFDNIAGVLRMSQALMERYLAAARTISRMAVGSPPPAIDSVVYRVAEDVQQHHRVEELPFGTRGGLLVEHFFSQSADYDIKVEVSGDEGLSHPHLMEVTIDGQQVRLFEVGRPALDGPEQSSTNTAAIRYATDGVYEVRVSVAGGPQAVGVTFYKQPTQLVEQVREVFENPTISSNIGVGGRMPTVTSVTLTGPHDPRGIGDTPSRQKVFVCYPESETEEGPCAREILSKLTRRAYRGSVADGDVDVLLGFYERSRARGGSFDDGIELALRRLLVSPEFLYRIEADPPAGPEQDSRTGMARADVYRIDELALASRLSFFLWSTIPDDELLELALEGRLHDATVIEGQVRRMLADPRSSALTTNFAGQWLQLRNLETVVRPGDPYARAFDASLRQGFLRETELFIDNILRKDRSVLDMLTADYTYLNERVARHYGLMTVQGSHFRRVTLPPDSPRRGLLGHGSVLTLTSHAIRTSPVNRGKWILDNILGTPPPDPPPNIPALDDRKTQAKVATLRDRMSAHRANPVCASCHNMIDPAGFALENFDAIGRWRAVDESYNSIDASGTLPDGTHFDGVRELTAALVSRPERFVTTVTEKLLTYALGRGLEYYDMPALRRVVRDAGASNYGFQDVVIGIVKSYPFLHRRVDERDSPPTVASR